MHFKMWKVGPGVNHASQVFITLGNSDIKCLP